MNKWEKVKIGDFLFEREGRYKPDSKEVNSLKRLEKIDFKGNIHIGDKSSRTDMIIVKDGDFVISGINIAKGAMAIYRGEEDVTATIHYSSYTFNEEMISIDYFEWFLKSDLFIKALREQVKGGIKTEIKAKHLLPLQIELPDLSTQKEIVRNLNSKSTRLLQLREHIDENAEVVKNLRQQILQDAITGKLSEKWRKKNPDVDSAEILVEKIKAEKEKLTKEGKIRKQKYLPPINDNETPFELPDGWMWCRLGEVFQASDYGTSEKAYVSDEGVPVLGMGNIQDLKVILDAPKKLSLKSKDLPRLFMKKYDLLFNRTNSYELVGKSAIFMGNDNQYTFASYLIRLNFNLNYIRPEYISYLINSDWFRKYVVEPQIVQQTGQANFNGTKLGESYVPLPPFNEQTYLVNQVEKLLSQLNRVKEINEDSKKIIVILNQSVFKEMFDV